MCEIKQTVRCSIVSRASETSGDAIAASAAYMASIVRHPHQEFDWAINLPGEALIIILKHLI